MHGLFLLTALAFGLQQPAADAELAGYFERARVELGAPGAALVIVRAGSEPEIVCGGVRDLGTDAPVTPETLFALCSNTKPMTATVVAMLAADGVLGWDDPPRAHIDGFRLRDEAADAGATLRDLASHRTGLPRTNELWWDGALTREEMVLALANVGPTAPFRERFQYQNVGFAALGLAAGRAAGTTWEELVRARLFEPLGMEDGRFQIHDGDAPTNCASPHALVEGVTAVIARRPLDAVGPAGAVTLHARDVARWLAFQLDPGELLNAAALAEMRTPHIDIPVGDDGPLAAFLPGATRASYGLGWLIAEYGEHRVFQHGGGIDGYSTLVSVLPEQGVAIAVLANVDWNTSFFAAAVSYRAYDLYFGREARDWIAHYAALSPGAREAR